MLANHVPVGMSHLFGDPVNRRYTCGQQLTGVRVPALARPAIAHPCREQVSLKEPVPYDEVVDVRQTAFGVQEDKVQFVLPYRLVVPLDDINGFRFPFPIQRIDLLQCVPGGCE